MIEQIKAFLQCLKDLILIINPFRREHAESFDFWRWMLCHPVRCVLWFTIITLTGVFYPGYVWPLVVATTVASIMLSLRSTLRDGASYVMAPVVNGLASINQTVAAEGFSVKNVLKNAQKHSIGLMACAKDIVTADNPSRVISESLKIGSMAGLEHSLVTTAIGKVANAVAGGVEPPVIAAREQNLADELGRLMPESTWESKRALGLAGLALSLSGSDPAGLTSSIVNPITRANTASKALEETFERVEEYLNSIGVIQSGKWAYFKEINDRVDKLRPEFEWCNQQIASFPAHFCRPTDYRRFKKLKEEIEAIDKILRRNTTPDLKNGKIMVGVQAMLTQSEQWERVVSQVRSTNGIRPVPVGVCLQGPSQVGKSTLYQELFRRIKKGCFEAYKKEPQKFAAFANAKDWQTWNMQTRDDYDQGYGGQEAVYTDDGFSDAKTEDHAQWLSFISGEAIGTVQADLQSKGLAFQANLAVVSCNNLPTTSLTINNITALQKRFPFTVSVFKKHAPTQEYDPDFKHLSLHMASMDEHCALLKKGSCNFAATGKRHVTCEARDIELPELVTLIVERMCLEEIYFQNRLRVLTGDIAEEQIDSDDVENYIDWDILDQIESGSSSTSDDEEDSEDLSSEAESSRDVVEEVTRESISEPVVTPATQKMKAVIVKVVEDHTKRWRRMILGAFTREKVTSLTDGRIATWASCLRRECDKLSFVEFALNEPDTVFQFMASLGAWEIIPGRKDEFERAILRVGKLVHRIHDETFDTDYIWSPCIEGGSVMFVCPSVTGTVRRLDADDPEHNELSRFIGYEFTPSQAKLGSEFEIFRLVRHSYGGNTQWKRVFVGINLLFGNLPAVMVRACLGDRYSAEPLSFQPSVFLRTNPWRVSPNRFKRVGGELVALSAPVLECFAWVRRVCDLIADYVHYAVIKLFDFLGFKPNDVIEDLLEMMAEIGAAKLLLIVLPLVVAAIYLVIKGIRYLRSGQSTPVDTQAYAGKVKHKFRADKVVRRSKQFSLFDAAKAVVTPPEGKVNYYQRTDCPFDDFATISADGEPIELDEYWAKPNKFPDSGLGNDWVILSKKHLVTNPLEEKEQFLSELDAVDDLAERLDTKEVFFFERNFGPKSGGSVPHAHIKLSFANDVDVSREMIHKPVIRKISAVSMGVARCCNIEFEAPFEQMDALYDLIQSCLPPYPITSWFMEGVVISGVIEMSMVLVSTKEGTVHRYLTRKEIAGITSRVDLLKRGVLNTPAFKEVVAASSETEPVADETKVVMKAVEQQSKDDAALTILRNLTETHTVLVAKSNVDPAKRQSIFAADSTIGCSCAGIAIGDKVVMPAHAGKLGDFVKVYPLGAKTLCDKLERLKVSDGQYVMTRIVSVDTTNDVAMAHVLTRVEAEKLLSAMAGGEVYLPRAVPIPPAYSTKILGHLMKEDSLIRLLEQGATIVQWFPTTGAIGAGCATYTGTRKFIIDGRNVSRRWIFVDGIETAVALSQGGDCGGLLAVMNPKFSRKILGFHVAGNARGTNACLFSQETYQTLLSTAALNVSLEMKGVVLKAHTEFPSDGKPVAGLGHTQIMTWPRIEWAKSDPFLPLIQEADGPDSPIGPDVLNVGVVREPVLPALTHKGVASGWFRPIFNGAFEERMQPAVLSPSDPRLEAELPLNKEGRPSLLLKPNTVLAQRMPDPDLAMLNEIYDQTLDFYINTFQGKKIGYPGMGVNDLVHEALNGLDTNEYMHGPELHAAAGYPWCNSPDSKKKSDLVKQNDDGILEIVNTPEGQFLTQLLRNSIIEGTLGRRYVSFCMSKLKDTCVKLKHVAAGKTRVFNCSSFEDIVLSHSVLARFREVYTHLRFEMNHAVGIDPMSQDWSQVYDYLNVFPNWFDVDYANYDKHLLSVFIRMADSIMIETIDAVDPDEYRLLRYVCCEKAINSLMLDISSVWQTEHGNKSGDFDTTPRNSKVNFLMVFYCYSRIMGRVDLGDFKRNVRFLSFGDDIIITVSDEVKDKFNFLTMQAELALFGQEATPGSKGDDCKPFMDKFEATFLKRRFAFVGGMCVGPVDQVSLEAKYSWSQVPKEHVDIWTTIVDNDLLEAALWGEEYYEHFRRRLLSQLSKRSVPAAWQCVRAHLCVSWASQIEKLRVKRGILMKPRVTSTIEGLIASNESTLYEELDKLDITSLSADVSALSTRLDALVLNVQNLATSVDTAIGAVNVSIANLKTQVDANTEAIAAIDVDVAQIAVNTSDIAYIQTRLASDEVKIGVNGDSIITINNYLDNLKACKTLRGSTFLAGMQYLLPLVDDGRTAYSGSALAVTNPSHTTSSPSLKLTLWNNGSMNTVSYGDQLFLQYDEVSVHPPKNENDDNSDHFSEESTG